MKQNAKRYKKVRCFILSPKQHWLHQGVNMRSTLWIVFFLAVILLPGICQAGPEDSETLTSRQILTSTRGFGLANAMSASGSGTAAVWHNPAAITSAMMYSVDASYFYDHNIGGHGFETNVVDMKSNKYVGAGMGFLYQYANPGASQHTAHLRLGLGVPLADNLISLGVTGMYTYLKYDDQKMVSQFSMDAGIIVRPLSWLSLAFTAQNLITGDNANRMPRLITAGISAGSLDLGLNVMFDASFNVSASDIAKTGAYALGVEYVLKKLVPVRIGYRYETDTHHVLAAGLGYRHQEGLFGLDLSYQHHFQNVENDIFSASINFYF